MFLSGARVHLGGELLLSLRLDVFISSELAFCIIDQFETLYSL